MRLPQSTCWLLLLLFSFPLHAQQVHAQRLVIHGATVIDGGDVRRSLDIVVAGEVIERVGACRDHGDAAVIDATGKFVVPGLIDMHAHVLLHRWDEKGEIEPRYDREEVLRTLRLLLAHGVTTIRDPGSETEAAVTFRKLLAEGKIDGPRMFTAGRILIGSNFTPEPFTPVRTVADVQREIRWQAAAGVDAIKIYSSISPELARAAIDEARVHGLPVIGHLQRTSWTEAARLGIAAIEHGAPFSPDYLPEAARAAYEQSLFGRVYWLEQLDLTAPAVRALTDALVQHRVAVDPTLIANHTKFFGNDPRWLENGDNTLVSAAMLAGWKAGSFTRGWTAEQYAAAQRAWPKQLAFTKLLFDRGVLLTAGTDQPTPWIVPGASLHSELELLASAGIAPRHVLRIATRNAAIALRREGQLGTIAPGASADLLLLTKNPLVDIRNTRSIELVIARGKRFVPGELLLR